MADTVNKSKINIKYDAATQTYFCRVMVKGKRKYFSSNHLTRKKAEQEIFAKIDDWLESDHNITNDKITLEEAWKRFLEYKSQFIRPTSLNSLKYKYCHLKPLGKRTIASIHKNDYQKIIYDAFTIYGLGKISLKNVGKIITDFSKFCAIKNYIEDHQVPLFFDIPKNAQVKEKQILTPEDIKILFDPKYDNIWYVPMYRFVLLTGLRRGEFCALQKGRDHSREHQVIRINETISHELIVTKGKTPQALRTIILPQPAILELERHLQKQREAGFIASPYLFCTPQGNRINPKVFLAEWSKWKKTVGIKCTLHELRHTFASYSVQKSKIDLDTFKKIFGHSRTMDTCATYVHDLTLTQEEKLEEIEKMRVLSENISDTLMKYTK